MVEINEKLDERYRQQKDGVFDEDDDWRIRCLQELTFFRMVSASHTKETFAWHLENTMRMRDHEGRYHAVLHRIFYFTGRSKPGICYSLCLYNLAAKEVSGAWLMNTLTGERKKLDVENSPLLTERERLVLQLIREGKSSKQIAERFGISKHTVDRHRQNIIAKLQVSNTTEACHKAKLLGLIE